MSRAFRALELFAVVVILLVASISFIAGVVQSGMSSMADEHYTVSEDISSEASQISSHARYLVDSDRDLIFQAEEIQGDLFTDIFIWSILVNNQNATLADNLTYSSRIMRNIWRLSQTYNDTWIHHMWHFFEVEMVIEPPPIEEPPPSFGFADKLMDGYDFFITENKWEKSKIKRTLNASYPMGDFLGDILIGPEHSAVRQLILNDPELLTLKLFKLSHESIWAFENMTRGLVVQMNIDADRFNGQGNSFGELADMLSVAVSITTVAIILATAMSSRLEDRRIQNLFTRVRADVLGQEDLYRDTVDKLSIPILLIAAGISLLGFLFTMIPNLENILILFPG